MIQYGYKFLFETIPHVKLQPQCFVFITIKKNKVNKIKHCLREVK